MIEQIDINSLVATLDDLLLINIEDFCEIDYPASPKPKRRRIFNYNYEYVFSYEFYF